jgi:hypothetical protein
MTDSDELLSKADALLARWRSGAVVPQPPADYPLLTEVVKAWAADSGARMPEIPDEPDIPVLDASSAVPTASPAVPVEIPVLDSPEAPTLDAPSSPATVDAVLGTLEVADELPHLPPLETSPAPGDAGAVAVALEERVRLRVLEAIEPYLRASLDEPLRLRIEELARRLAVNIARDARNDILTLVRVAVQSAVARELDARRDERSGDR